MATVTAWSADRGLLAQLVEEPGLPDQIAMDEGVRTVSSKTQSKSASGVRKLDLVTQ